MQPRIKLPQMSSQVICWALKLFEMPVRDLCRSIELCSLVLKCLATQL